jgi:hypothetical protein
MINFEIENELQANLGSNEKLLWTGKPKTGIVFRSSDFFLIPFSLFWAGFAVFWEFSVISSGGPIFFMFWGIPFILMGLYITIGRFFIDAYKRGKTRYGITQDRIIIKSGVFSQDVKSLNIRTLSDISLDQKADNSGTITLGPSDLRSTMSFGIDFPGQKQPPKLDLIEDAKTVYQQIIDLQRHP